MSNASKAEIAEMAKREVMEFYKTLTQEQAQHYKEILEQVKQAKTTGEVMRIGKPIYLAMKENKKQTQQT